MRKAQVEKLWGASAAGCFNGADVGPCCREMAVVKDEVISLELYPVLCLVCQFMVLQPLYAMREVFVVARVELTGTLLLYIILTC